jgi:hypothetical protein
MDNLVGRFRLKAALEESVELGAMLEFGCVQYTLENKLVASSGDVLATGGYPVTPRQRVYQNITNNTKGLIKGSIIPAMVANDDFMKAVTTCKVKSVEDFFSGVSNAVPTEEEMRAVFTSPTAVNLGYKVIGEYIEYLVNFPELIRSVI